MKIKDLERTANIAWSPVKHAPILLAAGTAAQQLDASFNTNAALEIYSLNLTEPGLEMELKANASTEQRFHKIVWGAYGSDSSGTIVGGCDSGIVQIYNVSRLLKGENGLTSSLSKHVGPVHSLDLNPFQGNLLATGASESEIYIWDMNNTVAPMTPGTKSLPVEDVLSIQWNKQVQHILASTFVSKCVVWDLRKNEPIIKLTDTVSRIRWKVVAWHPEIATQLCLASEEDHAPIVQLWDLRFATSPLKTLENHQRGVLSMAWCAQDADLLITSGKDNRIVCWNPNSNQSGGEVLSEIARTNQWNFDVIWCPRNPALIACPSFDGHVSVYSLMGGKTQQIQTTNKIADSFPGMDGYIQAPVPQQNAVPVSVDLSKPPKWLKKPVGAKFGFGGKLITFTNEKNQVTQTQQSVPPGEAVPLIARTVYISQVVTEIDLVNKSMLLEQALEYGNFIEFCKNKADLMRDQHRRYIWHFLKANFEENPRSELLNLLGYKLEDVNNKLNELIGKNEIDGLTDHISNINSQGDLNLNNTATDEFANIAQNYEQQKSFKPFKIKTGNDPEGLIAEAILMGNVEAAVELCMRAKKYTEAVIIAMTGGSDLLAKTQCRYFKQTDGYLSFLISALVAEDWSKVVDNCDINSWKEALIAILNHCNDDEYPKLCERLGNRLIQGSIDNSKLAQDAQLCYICSGSFDQLVESWTDRTNSPEDLQELVELVMLLQKAIERQGRSVQVTGSLADLLARYAFILASQGNLQTALNYLGDSQDKHVSELRDRLYVSLRQKPLYMQRTEPRRTSTRQSFSSYPNQYNQPNQYSQTNPFNTNPLNLAPSQPWQQLGAFAQQPTAFAQQPNAFAQQPNAFVQQPSAFGQQPNVFVPQPAKPFSPAPTAPPPSAPPPRPTSVGSAHGGSGLPTRTKYVVDPSVQSNAYRTNQFNTNPLSSSQMFQNNVLPNSRISNNPYGSPMSVNPLAPSNPLLPSNSISNVHTSFQNPLSPNPLTTIANPAPLSPVQPSYQNQNAPSSYSNSEVGQSALNSLPMSTAAGWNDPPAYTKTSRIQKPDFELQEPITHPLYGTGSVSNLPYGEPASSIPNNMPYGNRTQPFNPSTQYPQQEPQNIFQPNNFNPQATVSNNFNETRAYSNFGPKPVVVQGQVEKPQPINQKEPIPEEHIHMQTVFDELKRQCSCATNNPQTKRKIDDVGKKLEALYDLLREHKLSPNTLAALHQIVQLIQNGNYSGGLNLHTQLVSGQDFSQIASFMPGLKVLLQCALQLQVYLR